jgi:putative NADPH-quinone reductase
VKVLVVHAHPDPASFNAHLRDRVVATLTGAGHRVDLIDLYAEGFDPVVQAHELSGTRTEPVLASHGSRLRSVEAVVFVYPTWWSGPPAMLKGWLDRVLVEGVAYAVKPGSARVRGRLHNIRHLVVVTTHGSPKWTNVLEGESGKLLFQRGIRLLCHHRARMQWLAMYGIDRADAQARAAFVGRLEHDLGRLGTASRFGRIARR